MSDSVLSLKQAVNSPAEQKAPRRLPRPGVRLGRPRLHQDPAPRRIRSAICELIKNVLAIAPDRYDWAAQLRPDAHYITWELTDFTAFCVDAKQQVMADDPHEIGLALIL